MTKPALSGLIAEIEAGYRYSHNTARWLCECAASAGLATWPMIDMLPALTIELLRLAPDTPGYCPHDTEATIKAFARHAFGTMLDERIVQALGSVP